MKLRISVLSAMLLVGYQFSYAQTTGDTTKTTLHEVIISANKTAETKKTVAQQVQVLDSADIQNSQAQSTADLLSNAGNLSVQKSQLGGGDINIRGFSANQNVYVIDGVRMNNLIYRAGHLQDIIKTDNSAFERVEILYGPSSTIYGSDALGGVIHLYTKKPMLATGDQNSIFKVNTLSRYGSVDNEITNHLDINYGTKKFATLTSFTYSQFGDLMSGKNQNPFYNGSYGERPYYAQRIDGKDSLVKNSNRYLQVGSGYNQYDVMEKVLFQQNEHISHGLNIQFSNSSDVPRYDRLTLDPSSATANTNALKSAEWYYGPQTRLLTAYDMNIKNPEGMFQNIHLGLNYQMLEESRHNRNFGSIYLKNRVENVGVIGANLDFQKTTTKHNIRFGLDMQMNSLKSTATIKDIVADTVGKLDTRFPDGKNSMNNFALYFSHTWKLSEQLVLTDGIRAGYSMLHSTLVDTALLFHLPYTDIKQNTPVVSGSIGLIHSPSDDLKLSLLFSTGYRIPNVDDMTKIFGSASGAVIVPNVDLKPEQTLNYEIGITKIFNKKTLWENSIYYSTFNNITVVDKFNLNGKDSIMYDGAMARVYANQNKGEAYVYGFSSNMISKLDDHFLFKVGIDYTYGRIKTDSMDTPLNHIPPFMAHTSFQYNNNKFSSEFSVHYCGAKKLKDYCADAAAEDNIEYATATGMPAWITANLRFSYKACKYLTAQAGIDNIFDTQYRTFASGINGPGRNVYAALRFNY